MRGDNLQRAGFREDCDDCQDAVDQGKEACRRHYIPTHRRSSSSVSCPTCGGGKRREQEVCGRCAGADL